MQQIWEKKTQNLWPKLSSFNNQKYSNQNQTKPTQK